MRKIKSETFFIISLLVFTSIIIYFLLSSLQIGATMETNSLNIESLQTNVISSIMNATDNAINKIYNIIIVLTVYITVVITTFSLF
ncbi:hypothetical protein [Sporosalibacterium faouarense]|uniref:hypothetical protein n=1 Tax=Sporosalibacterium faouarense TaxID=516123 RepID=UPI00192B7A08|nr:hypothetical protein [Sporosalibacterium faouarense]